MKKELNVEELLTPEELKAIHAKAEQDRIQRVKTAVKERSTDEDFWRPTYNGVIEGKTQQEIEEDIFLFNNSYLYDYASEELSEEDLHEYIYGIIPWAKYLKLKASKNNK